MGIGLGLGIAGLGLSALGMGANAISQARAARAQRRALDKRDRENEMWYSRRYNEVGTERASAQAALTAMRDAQRARMARASGAAAVTGASSEGVAAEKAAANKAIGETAATITAQDDARKDKIDAQYRAEKKDIESQRANLRQAQMANTAAAAGQAIGTAGAIIAGSGDFGGSKSNVPNTAVPAGNVSAKGGSGIGTIGVDGKLRGFTPWQQRVNDYTTSIWNK